MTIRTFLMFSRRYSASSFVTIIMCKITTFAI
nr:MAG TPA: hypothetical protein [Caudoviricetes sp.]